MENIKRNTLFITGIIVYLFKESAAVTQDTKTWNKNTNFLNPRNWESGQLPCENDKIVFPKDSPIITFMPESLTVAEMILPLNGELLFPENAVLDFTGGTREGSCTGKDMHFKANVDEWYDPNNWNITSDRAFPRVSNRRNKAVPHALQVPCVTDKVQFLKETSFQSFIFHPTTTVASLEINGVSYSQTDFENLQQTHIGSLLFPGNPGTVPGTFHITSTPCTDESGCVCGNDDPEVFPTVCQEVTPFCPSLECSDPITPVGNCCPICGARIVIKHKDIFKMERLITLHDSFLSKEEYQSVESFTAKTYEGDIQSVFVDGAQLKGQANVVASKIYEALNSDASGARLYGVQSLEIYKSEAWKSGIPTYDRSTRGMSSGGVASLVIVLLVALGLGAAFFVYRKRQQNSRLVEHITFIFPASPGIPGFNFARFDLRGDKIELELDTTPHDELQPVENPEASGSSEAKSKCFDNPVYGTTVEEVPYAAQESPEMKDFVENPMFRIFEASSKEENK